MHDRDGRLGDLYYRTWQPEDPRASVVISHGYAEHIGRYEQLAADLVAAGFAVWGLDHRGHGRSAGDRGDIVSWPSVVADLDLVVAEAERSGAGRPVFLAGHSLGGAIAIAYTLAHQDRLAGLSLSAPAIELPPEILALAELPEIPPLPLADGVSSDPSVVEAYRSDPLVYLGPPPANLLSVMASVGSLVERLGEITLPVQVMQGSADVLIPPAALRRVVAGVGSQDLTARLWPGLFHEIYNEKTDGAVTGALVSWIDERVR